MTKPSLFLYWVRLVYYPPYTTHLMILEIPSVLWRNLTTTVWLIFTVTLLWIYAMWVYLYLGLDGSQQQAALLFFDTDVTRLAYVRLIHGPQVEHFKGQHGWDIAY